MISKLFGAAMLPVGMGMLYLLHFVVARSLNSSDYGEFSLVVTSCSLLSILITAGLPGSAQKFISTYIETSDAESLTEYIRFNAWWLVGVIVFLIAISLSLSLGVLGETYAHLSIVLPLTTLATCTWLWQRYFCLGRGRIVHALLPREVLFPAFVVVIIIGFDIDQPDVVLTVYSVALLLVCVPFLILSVSDFAPLAVLESPDFSKIRSWLKTSKSFVITNTLQLGLNGWDILIMGAFASLAETGRYAAATRLAMIVMVVVRVANTTMGHRFSAIHSNSDFDRNEHLFKFARWICASAGVLVFIVLILAVNYLVPLLGDGFSGIETMVLLIAAANLVIVFMGPITGFLNMTGREAFVARCMTTWSILSVLLNFMLIPFFQAWGAVAALVVCNVGLRLQMIVRAPKLLSVKI